MAIEEYTHKSPIVGPLRISAPDKDTSLSPDEGAGQSEIPPDQIVEVVLEINGHYPGPPEGLFDAFRKLWIAGGLPGLSEVAEGTR